MRVPDLTSADQELLELLRSHDILTARQIQLVLAAREQAWSKHCPEGLFCTVSQGQLRLIDYASGQERAAFGLESGVPAQAPATLIYLDGDTGHEIARQDAPTELGLLIGSDGVRVAGTDPLGLSHWGLADRLPLVPGHDLAVSPDRRYLAVSERQAGRLQLFDLHASRRLAGFDIRELGKHDGIHLCFAADALWVSDTESSCLGRVALTETEWRLEWQETRIPELGPLLAGADGESLYVLVLNPLRLICLDLPNLNLRHELALLGTAISRGAPRVPADNLLAVQGGERLQIVYLTRQNQRSRPVQQQLTPRLSLAGEIQPLTPPGGWPWLVPAEANPLAAWAARELGDWIVELGFLSAEYLAYLRQDARLGLLADETESAFRVPAGDEPPFELLLRDAPEIEFAAGVTELVYELLVHAAEQQGVDVEAKQLTGRLQTEAVQVVEFLRGHYVALVEVELDIERLLFLDLVLERARLLQLLDRALEGRRLPWRPGHRCPMCQLLLPNPRLCRHCDFALEDADWQARRRLQSAEACDELIPGQLLLALPQARRVCFLDAWLQVISELEGYRQSAEGPIQPFKEPVHALALPEGSWLVCDKGLGQVLEITSAGELVRLFDHRFGAPVLASFRRENGQLSDILILDQAEGKILAFSRDGRLVSRWGGDDSLRLKAPRDLQWTWNETFLIADGARVLEWHPGQGETVQSWGAAQGLQKPVLARRQPDGATLIVDAGRGEVLRFHDADASSAFAYWPPPNQDPAWIGQGAPDRMLVLANGDLIGLGRRYWLLIQTVASRIRWVQPWTGARRPPNQKQRLLAIANEDPSLAPLRAIKVFQNLDSLALQQLKQLIEPVTVAAGEWVLRPDDASGTLMAIVTGEAGICRAQDEPPLARLRPGDSFGEVALVLGETYPAGLRALEELNLLQLKRGRYKQLVAHTGELGPLLREQAFTRKALLAQYQSGQLQERMDRVKAQLVARRLQELELFADFDADWLEELALRLRSLAYMPNQQIFGEGESGDTLYLIARGRVSVWVEGQTQALAQIDAGSVFGEMAVLDAAPRTATIRSEGYCQIYEIDRAALVPLWESEPRLQERLQALADARRPALTAAREHTPLAVAAPVMKATVQALTRVRPARVFGLSQLHQTAFCVDETGEIAWQGSPLAKLYRPTRLGVSGDRVWIADTGNERILALSKAEGHLQRLPELELSQPRSVLPTPDGRLLIAEAGKPRLLLVNAEGEPVWEYAPPREIMSPWYAEATLKGTVLFCDRELQMVFEIDLLSDGIVWTHGILLEAGDGPEALCEPSCVRRLPNGGTVIADTGNDRLLLFSPVGTLMRSFTGSEDIPLIRPVHLELLDSGEMLVYPEQGDEVIRLGLGGQPTWRACMPD